MNNRSCFLAVVVFILMVAVITSVVYAQEAASALPVDTNAYELPPQGTFIPCEVCVILYPGKYAEHPENCPVCHGAKEHFQPAQMMTTEMARMLLHEIDVQIQDLEYNILMESLNNPPAPERLQELRKAYRRKLIHLLVYDFIDVGPVKTKILELDKVLEAWSASGDV